MLESRDDRKKDFVRTYETSVYWQLTKTATLISGVAH